jgi:hypothetical protein
MEPSFSSDDARSSSEDQSDMSASAASTGDHAGAESGQSPESREVSIKSARSQERRDLVLSFPERPGSGARFSAEPSSGPAAAGFRFPAFLRKINGLQVAGAALLLGLGWFVGAHTFDRRAELASLEAQIHALNIQVARVQTSADSSTPRTTEVRSLGERQAGLRAEINALKVKLETAGRQAQTRDAEVLASLQRVEKDPRFDQLSGRIDRLERQFSSATPTGTISAAKSAQAAATVPAKTAKPALARGSRPGQTNEALADAERMRIPVPGYILRGVDRGFALVEASDGLHQIAPGDYLPGAGRVEGIERRDGEWVVVTSEGIIDGTDY